VGRGKGDDDDIWKWWGFDVKEDLMVMMLRVGQKDGGLGVWEMLPW